MNTKIIGSEAPVGKIFSDEFVFTIPSYQRPYSWEKAEEGNFWNMAKFRGRRLSLHPNQRKEAVLMS